ncbi:MAG: 4-alpha-glucanotransferase [Chloroflexota bacterium]
MTFKRASGILLHPTSLPGPHGIGDIGPQAYRFVDFLADSACNLWQVLPLGPTGYGDSPYQCFSAFAGNPYLISPEELIGDGLLAAEDLRDKPAFDETRVDFGIFIPWKLSLLGRAYDRFGSEASAGLREALATFRAANAAWLDDYALFMALKEAHGGGSWDGWPAALRQRDPQALAEARKTHAESIARYVFHQFLFYRQWANLHAYAKQRGVQIIGDIPIFVAYDSADVWSHPDLFHLDEAGKPTVVAGVPPDFFSATGQMWGNPLYKWEVHQATGYAWWLERMRATLSLVDIVRLDHFRGFAGYWEIPAGNDTAEFGRWVPGPGADLFDALMEGLQKHPGESALPIIAEDLGVITDDVVALRERYNFPGMKILQFGFTAPSDPFLPHNYVNNCVAYTGTHDNNTARGWYEAAPEQEREFALKYLGVDGSHFAWDLIRAVWSSTAVFSVAPMQDFLNLGVEARMNFPSRLGGNWEWRMKDSDLNDGLLAKIRELNYLYSR